MIAFLVFLIPLSLSIAALVAFVTAIPLSYRLEELKAPGQPRARRQTDLAASAFGPAPEGEGVALRARLRQRLFIALALFGASGGGGLMLAVLFQ